MSVEYAEKTGFPVRFSDNATIAACAREDDSPKEKLYLARSKNGDWGAN